jgi:hypothetical protein
MADNEDDVLKQEPQDLPVDGGDAPEFDEDNPPGPLDLLKAAKDGAKMLKDLKP